LEGLPIQVVSKADAGFGDLDVVEDGETLEANALKKAHVLKGALVAAGCEDDLVLADDTGLFVDALHGQPGVYSARYAGEDCTYEDNNKKMLAALADVVDEKRTAHFETVIAIVWPDGSSQTVSGICRGRIGREGLGDNGFGYDPLFIVEGRDLTFAQMKDGEKNQISHRANALRKLREVIEKTL
jgi:XTP/dITP diphosphohydrolase